MNTKYSVYPAVVVACLLGLVGLVLVWLQFTISVEPIEPDSSLPKTIPPKPHSESGEPLVNIPSQPTLGSKPIESLKQDTPSVSSPEPRVADGQGALRVSNQTDQPVRVALLARSVVNSSTAQPAYGIPAHWDFAPGEGSRQGLTLSMPKGNLKLKKGDILVAFAQDGSRRYWGPYVVGETTTPVWHSPTAEWQLILLNGGS